MQETIKKIQNFISYWYIRYLLAIELYMVEPWERIVFHIVFALLFSGFWYLNYSMIVSPVAVSKPYVELMAKTLI